jgi:hypothetical protein
MAAHARTLSSWNSVLQILAETWRPCLCQYYICPLGWRSRMVQQNCLECWPADLQTVLIGPWEVQVEQDAEVPIHQCYSLVVMHLAKSITPLASRCTEPLG